MVQGCKHAILIRTLSFFVLYTDTYQWQESEYKGREVLHLYKPAKSLQESWGIRYKITVNSL